MHSTLYCAIQTEGKTCAWVLRDLNLRAPWKAINFSTHILYYRRPQSIELDLCPFSVHHPSPCKLGDFPKREEITDYKYLHPLHQQFYNHPSSNTHTHTHPTMLLLIIRILKDKRFLPRFVLCVQYSKYANIIGRGKYLNSLGSLNNRLIFLYTINSQGIAWKSLSLLRWTPVISEWLRWTVWEGTSSHMLWYKWLTILTSLG